MVIFIPKEFRDCNAEKANKNERNVEVILTTFLIQRLLLIYEISLVILPPLPAV